ncbi:uncharacterized protein N7459_002020 [Penicillium hispanicum]|uniref:uncharacterized protein n=1 Tax=Penicillium hispanicum TaxID=1080232 RepID=UPI0025417B4B|nr:uncharacterized protein N7459_002020 [Penicillium hispanicum]KAJ5591651.1 hypothetical protein N7459_002020 [Penicillium hispanicum]
MYTAIQAGEGWRWIPPSRPHPLERASRAAEGADGGDSARSDNRPKGTRNAASLAPEGCLLEVDDGSHLQAEAAACRIAWQTQCRMERVEKWKKAWRSHACINADALDGMVLYNTDTPMPDGRVANALVLHSEWLPPPKGSSPGRHLFI